MKKIMSLVIVTALSLSFSGCAPKANKLASNLQNASIGMTKNEIIKTLGYPESASAINNIEFLRYNLCSRQMTFAEGPTVGECLQWTKYYVRIKNGKVDSYGEVGDFDSTKIKETKQTINLNINNSKG